MKWISIKDKLPENYCPVLVYDDEQEYEPYDVRAAFLTRAGEWILVGDGPSDPVNFNRFEWWSHMPEKPKI